jgi:hypothetical protein
MEKRRKNKRNANQSPQADAGKEGTGHAFAEAIMNARRAGGAENMPYFVEDGMCVPILKPNGDKLPKERKEIIRPNIDEEPSEIVADQTAVLRMERELER